jgi:hypothetical protein
MAKNKNRNLIPMVAIVAILVVILIVAVVSVPSIGNVFGNIITGGSSACTAQSGFSCGSLAYSHSTGTLSVTLSQSSGYNWAVVDVLFVPQGTALSNGLPMVSWDNAATLNNGLANGVAATVSLPVSGAVSSGTAISGTVWVRYSMEVGGTTNYAQVGAFNNLHAK